MIIIICVLILCIANALFIEFKFIYFELFTNLHTAPLPIKHLYNKYILAKTVETLRNTENDYIYRILYMVLLHIFPKMYLGNTYCEKYCRFRL